AAAPPLAAPAVVPKAPPAPPQGGPPLGPPPGGSAPAHPPGATQAPPQGAQAAAPPVPGGSVAPPGGAEDEAEVVAIAPKARPVRETPPPKQWRCKAGKTIFQEDESSFDIFILEEGKVEIIVAEERVAVVSTPGVVLGEIGALLKRPRSAAVKALTPCTFTVYQDFESLMQHDPDKLLEVARTLATRLADTNDKIQKVFGILYQAKVKDEVVDNVALALQGKKPKPNQKDKGFWAKLGF
ncbi:MAG: Crp/Fnr family transcriptional regulator, partial [Candidatus Sericytochromatia bacterium]|nr:Crp/Fnr family transcriptional regulator [Candidatus Tanganyikabacteria bacterium]